MPTHTHTHTHTHTSSGNSTLCQSSARTDRRSLEHPRPGHRSHRSLTSALRPPPSHDLPRRHQGQPSHHHHHRTLTPAHLHPIQRAKEEKRGTTEPARAPIPLVFTEPESLLDLVLPFAESAHSSPCVGAYDSVRAQRIRSHKCAHDGPKLSKRGGSLDEHIAREQTSCVRLAGGGGRCCWFLTSWRTRYQIDVRGRRGSWVGNWYPPCRTGYPRGQWRALG